MTKIIHKAIERAALAEHVLTIAASVAIVAEWHTIETYSTSGLVVAGVVAIFKDRR